MIGENFFDSIRFLSSEETLTRIMIYEIRERNPEAVKFVVKTQDVKSILFHMKTKRYKTLMYLYGHLFLLEILKFFEECERYEDCQEIVDQIREHNLELKDNIKTTIN